MNVQKFKKIMFLFIIVFITQLSMSAPIQAEICRDIHGQKITPPSKWMLYWTMVKLRLLPGSFAKPEPHQFQIDPTQLRRESTGIKYRNIIFSVGPVPTDEQNITQDNKDELAILDKKIQEHKKKLVGLIRTKDYESCQGRQKENGFDEVFYQELQTREQDFYSVRNLTAQSVVDKNWGKIRGNLNLNWELIRFTDLNQVKKILSTGNIANVIFLTHGTNQGTLVDSRIREFPQDYFSHLSPSILSISIYSCYSDKVVEYYNLKHSLKASLSYHKNRFLVQVQKGGALGGQAPIQGFTSFLKRVDTLVAPELVKTLQSQKSIDNSYPELSTEKSCELKVSSNLSDRDYGVFFNRQFLGLLTGAEDVFTYPCSKIIPETIF